MSRDVTTGSTGTTMVAPKNSDTLTLFQPGGGADSAQHRRGHTKNFPMDASLLSSSSQYHPVENSKKIENEIYELQPPL